MNVVIIKLNYDPSFFKQNLYQQYPYFTFNTVLFHFKKHRKIFFWVAYSPPSIFYLHVLLLMKGEFHLFLLTENHIFRFAVQQVNLFSSLHSCITFYFLNSPSSIVNSNPSSYSFYLLYFMGLEYWRYYFSLSLYFVDSRFCKLIGC